MRRISGDAGGYNASISNLTRLWGSETISFFGVDPTEAGALVTERLTADGELRPLADFGSFALTNLAIGRLLADLAAQLGCWAAAPRRIRRPSRHDGENR